MQPAKAMSADRRNALPRAFAKGDELFGIDLRSLAALRVATGMILASDLLHRLGDTAAFYGDEGVLPRFEIPAPWNAQPLPHLLGGSVGYQASLILLQVLLALAVAAGYRTFGATALSWFFLVSLEARNPYILQGSDGLFRVLLLWGMLLPWGKVWSLDSRRRSVSDSNSEESTQGARVLSVASAGLLLQVCVVYLFSAALKDPKVWHTEGSAVFRALSVDCWTTDFGRMLLPYPFLLKFLSRATYWLEIVGPMLAFCPVGTSYCRLLAVACFWSFHLVGLAPTMYLGPFPFLSAASWLVFLPACFWDRGREHFGEALGRFFDGLFEFLPPFLRPAAKPEVAPSVAGTLRAGRGNNLVASVILVNMFVWNSLELRAGDAGRKLPRVWSKIAFTLRLDQRWGMFAPAPRTADGWFVIVGTTADGVDYDLIRGGTAILWEKPARVADWFDSYRWRCYLLTVHKQARTKRKEQFARYLCKAWSARHDGEDQVKKIRIYYMLERTLPNWTTAPPTRQLFHSHDCDARAR